MLIYTNGCSVTAGTGLADYLMLEYPGDLNISQSDEQISKQVRQWVDLRNSIFKKNQELKFKIDQEQKKLSWPYFLSQKLGAKLINRAVQSSSIDSIVLRSILDLNELIEKDRKPDKIFIGLTLLPRTSLPEINFIKEEDIPWRKAFYDFHVGYDHSGMPEIYKAFNDVIWTALTDDNLLIKYYQYMIMLNAYCYEQFNFYPIYVDCGLKKFEFSYVSTVHNSKNLLLHEFRKISRIDNLLDRDFHITSNSSWEDTKRVADGHVISQYHRDLAERVYKKIISQ